MNIKVKTMMISVFTLLIGIALGLLINRTLFLNQFERRTAEMGQAHGIIRQFERIIEVDESQTQMINSILSRYSNRLLEQRAESFRHMVIVMDSLRAELDSLLTAEQKERLNQRLEHMEGPRGLGPGPPLSRPRLRGSNIQE